MSERNSNPVNIAKIMLAAAVAGGAVAGYVSVDKTLGSITDGFDSAKGRVGEFFDGLKNSEAADIDARVTEAKIEPVSYDCGARVSADVAAGRTESAFGIGFRASVVGKAVTLICIDKQNADKIKQKNIKDPVTGQMIREVRIDEGLVKVGTALDTDGLEKITQSNNNAGDIVEGAAKLGDGVADTVCGIVTFGKCENAPGTGVAKAAVEEKKSNMLKTLLGDLPGAVFSKCGKEWSADFRNGMAKQYARQFEAQGIDPSRIRVVFTRDGKALSAGDQTAMGDNMFTVRDEAGNPTPGNVISDLECGELDTRAFTVTPQDAR